MSFYNWTQLLFTIGRKLTQSFAEHAGGSGDGFGRYARGLRAWGEADGEGFRSRVVLYTGGSVVKLGDGRFWGVPLAKFWEM